MILSCVDEPELSTKSAKQCISDVYSIPEMGSGTFGERLFKKFDVLDNGVFGDDL